MIPQQNPTAIIEFAEERDRKHCVALDRKVDGANRELAQWLLDHPIYTAPQVAGWLGCGVTRIKDLRRWAVGGFEKTPSDERRDRADYGRRSADEVLKSNDNFEDDAFEPGEHVEEPVQVLKNLMDTVRDAKALAEACRKICKVSPFDREAKTQLYDAINLLIVKWRTVQSTLDRKGRANGQSQDD